MFFDRQSRGTDSYLRWKMSVLAVAAVLILLGVRLQAGWLIWSAIGVLGLGFVLRFLPATDDDSAEGVKPEDG